MQYYPAFNDISGIDGTNRLDTCSQPKGLELSAVAEKLLIVPPIGAVCPHL
jgi:hypothetical protein